MTDHHHGIRPHRQGGPRVVTEVRVVTHMVTRGVPLGQSPQTVLPVDVVDAALRLAGLGLHVDLSVRESRVPQPERLAVSLRDRVVVGAIRERIAVTGVTIQGHGLLGLRTRARTIVKSKSSTCC